MAMTKRTVTTNSLINRIRTLGEIRSAYINNAVMVSEINQSRLDLYGKLLDAGACDYFEQTQDINVVSGTNSYDLPNSYHATLGVDVLLTNGEYSTLERYSFQDRNLLSDTLSYDRWDTKYRIRGDYITLSPTPDWTETNGIRHYYVAVPTDLNTSLTNETIDGFWGWEDYIVYDCLVKFIGGTEEGDASQWMQERQRIESRIERTKSKRDRGNADVVANVDYGVIGRRRRRYGIQ